MLRRVWENSGPPLTDGVSITWFLHDFGYTDHRFRGTRSRAPEQTGHFPNERLILDFHPSGRYFRFLIGLFATQNYHGTYPIRRPCGIDLPLYGHGSDCFYIITVPFSEIRGKNITVPVESIAGRQNHIDEESARRILGIAAEREKLLDKQKAK